MKSFTRFMWSIALTAMLLAGVLASAQQDKSKDAQSAATAKSPTHENKGSGSNPLFESKDGKAKTFPALDAGS